MAVLADRADSPNQVFVYNNSNHTASAFLINGATAAAFSPDGLKAYIAAGSKLYVFSKVDAFQTIPLNAPVNDVQFFPQGGFGLLAGGDVSALTVRHTCDNGLAETVNLAATPSFVRPLPDAATVLALEPPFVQFINLSPPAGNPWVGCAPPIQDTIVSTLNLGQGNFIPRDFIISADGTAGYILGDSALPNSAPLPFMISLDIMNQTSSLISLSGNATPLSASLSPTGNLLFVGADDNAVHVVDTSSGIDTEQVTFAFPQSLCFGPGNPATPVPLTQVAISGAAQNGSSTAYTYSLTTGPALQNGQRIIISGMKDGGDNGTFTITGFGVDSSGNPTFIVNNASGVTAGGQNGSGVVAITCNPDLVAVKP
jgi:WD40 repeat protein